MTTNQGRKPRDEYAETTRAAARAAANAYALATQAVDAAVKANSLSRTREALALLRSAGETMILVARLLPR